ncbi:2-dehydro-3-deoxy-6-phosphogalactonate aldolase [Rhizobiaceae bacterium BDR2-2]|uniref:2-dehydro-3-deoxy-6-phosphogalactonate aldolase n=1 Tax=Ectorhizobium quercum TaxID=2965071 RepID=A0AAE3SW18_9HYPH|nr:2-dehydro-3-deoxy-6-phosphogalactonate aldolase [Ectorhizobium quercum]MCX8998273.1 2-dehydro-3-deoxy-6-phosphogalactonate aldolase [Ectorhizobium quercum]
MTRNIIAILRGIRPEDVEAHVDVLVAAGITTIEVPLNSPEPFDSIGRLIARFAGRAMIGAGTVLEVADVRRLAEMGAAIVVSPNCDPAVIAATRAAGMESWPGVFTPTECFAALKAGATGLKFFPATLIGPAGIAAVRAVLPKGTPLYAVGGAGADNFPEWIRAGATGFGIGTALYRPGQSVEATAAAAAKIVSAYDAALAAAQD